MSASQQVRADEARTEKPRSTNPLSKFSVQIVIGLIAGILCSAIAFAVCTQVLLFSYSASMMLSMALNFMSAYLFCFFGPRPAKDEIESTYYFSPKFSEIQNIPK